MRSIDDNNMRQDRPFDNLITRCHKSTIEIVTLSRTLKSGNPKDSFLLRPNNLLDLNAYFNPFL